MRDASPALPGEHWITIALLVNPEGRRQMEEFGYNLASLLSDLPVLEWFCACFRFSLTSERWVEALHAVSARVSASAHNFGPVHLGFHTVLGPLRERLGNDASVLQALADAAVSVRNPLQCLRHFGLMGHPGTQELIQASSGSMQQMNKNNRGKMIDILFHTDSLTLYSDQPKADCMAPAAGGPDDDDGPPPPPSGGGLGGGSSPPSPRGGSGGGVPPNNSGGGGGGDHLPGGGPGAGAHAAGSGCGVGAGLLSHPGGPSSSMNVSASRNKRRRGGYPVVMPVAEVVTELGGGAGLGQRSEPSSPSPDAISEG